MKDQKYDFPTLDQAIIWARLDTGATLVDRWEYVDRDGIEVFHVLGLVRDEDGRKALRTVWLMEYGAPGYRVDEPPRPWPLYRLPELSQGGRIYLCQSEALAERAREAGLLATTSAHGAAAVHKTDWSPLAGREIVILPNSNEDGRVYARRAIGMLTRQSPPAQVQVLALPGLEANGTVADFIDRRLGQDLRSIGSEIEDLAELTPEYWQLTGRGGQRRLAGPAVPTPLAQTRAAQLQWLWPGRIAVGRLNLLSGGPGAGQSLLGADLAARVSRGAAWPDGSGSAPPGSVLFLADRQRMSDAIGPALAGADASRIITLQEFGPASGCRGFAAVATLERALEREPCIRLVVIDPLSAYFAGNLCSTLAALEKLAADHRLAVALVATLNGKTAGLARLRTTGGHALDAARAAWLVVTDRREADRRLLLPVKSDTAQQVLAYRVAGGRLAWEPGVVDVAIGELLSDGQMRRKPGFPPVKRRAAARWLRQHLSHGPPGPLRREAEAAGWSWITVRRALQDIGAISERSPRTGHSQWRLAM